MRAFGSEATLNAELFERHEQLHVLETHFADRTYALMLQEIATTWH